VFTATAITGCYGTDHPVAPEDRRSDSQAANDLRHQSIESIARLLASAMAHAEPRDELFQALRDSPFPLRAVHASSFLASPTGAIWIRAAMIASGGPSAEAVLQGLPDLGDLEIIMIRPWDRMRWDGSSPVRVFAAPYGMQPDSPASSFRGYDHHGREINIGAFEFSSEPYVVLRPVQLPFPDNPEAVRRVAQPRDGHPISTREYEMALMSVADCDPDVAIIECPEDPPMAGGQVGYHLDPSVTFSACTSGVGPDSDRDGIRDDCEYALAFAFRPQLIMNPFDAAPDREPYWAVRKGAGANEIMIFYLFSYHRDAGVYMPGSPLVHGSTSHDGDSEFVVITVRNPIPTYHRWVLEHATLSAHWNEWTNATALYNWDWLEPHDVWGGRPRIWVARNKHANYRKKSVCDQGAFFYDTCHGNQDLGPLDILPSRNIGNHWERLIDQVYSQDPSMSGVEHFWTGIHFKGWHTGSTSAGGYNSSLWVFGPF
jgi:hypothetical protein